MGAGGAATGTGSSGVVGNEVHIMNAKNEDRTTSFFSQPGILAGKINRGLPLIDDDPIVIIGQAAGVEREIRCISLTKNTRMNNLLYSCR